MTLLVIAKIGYRFSYFTLTIYLYSSPRAIIICNSNATFPTAIGLPVGTSRRRSLQQRRAPVTRCVSFVAILVLQSSSVFLSACQYVASGSLRRCANLQRVHRRAVLFLGKFPRLVFQGFQLYIDMRLK